MRPNRGLSFALSFWEVIAKPMEWRSWWECLCFGRGPTTPGSLTVVSGEDRPRQAV